MENYVNTVLRPLLQGDGGEIEFISEKDGLLTVRFRGECAKCAILERCVKWCEEKILTDTGTRVKLSFTRQKPFFWDK